MKKTVYDKATGRVLRTLNGEQDFIDLNYSPSIEGLFDGEISSGMKIDPVSLSVVIDEVAVPEQNSDFPTPVSFSDFFRAYAIGGIHLDLFMQQAAAQLN